MVSGTGALVGLAAAGAVIGSLTGAPPTTALVLLALAGVALALLSTLAAMGPAAKARRLSARTLSDDG